MISYWEQQSFTQYGVIVVGAGLTGLYAALCLADKFPGRRILVLERGLFPSGASTRNAGFAATGSASELLDDLHHGDEGGVSALCAARLEGIRKMRSLLGDEYIGFRKRGSHELVMHHEVDLLDEIPRLNALLNDLGESGKPVFEIADDRIGRFGFARDRIAHLVENTLEGEIHTGKMMRRLTDLVLSKGVEIKTGVRVVRFEEEEHAVAVLVGAGGVETRLSCVQLLLCTNAFTDMLLPGAGVMPARGQVLVTDPIPDLKVQGIFHFDRGYYYFREIDGRILIGGGRNLDFEGETTVRLALNQRVQDDLETKLRELVLPGTPFGIAKRWAGIMGFTREKKPQVTSFGDRVHGAFGYSGMGVALAPVYAEKLVELMETLD